MAPTKPLVKQQQKACIDIMKIPESETVTLEGTTSVKSREVLWQDHNVIFCTPQVAENDLRTGKLNAYTVVCVLIDEAHRATSNYAYTEFVQLLLQSHPQFRVVALSATPGSDISKIQQVINNLLISHTEIRTEDDPDVAPYVYDKEIEVIACSADGNILSPEGMVLEHIEQLMLPPLRMLFSYELIQSDSPANMNSFVVKELER
jgi:ERCC4-related helicase